MNKRIFVGNLPWAVTLDQLKEIFGKYGEIEDAIIMANKYTGKSRGFGFVTFKEESSAEKAIAEMNNKDVQGREITVTEARPLKKEESSAEEKEEIQKEEPKSEESSE